MDIIKISGSVGMIKLVKDNKNLYIFFDVHSNKLYCKDDDSIFIHDVFDKIIKTNSDYIILLEEPFVNNYSNIKLLWNDTPHIVKFRNFYKKIIKQCSDTKKCNVFPVDIRLIICDISMDELISNINSVNYFNDYKIYVYDYFKQLLYLFDYIDWDNKLFKDINLKILKKVLDKFKHDKYYIKLKEQFDKFNVRFIKPNSNVEIGIFLKKNQFILDKYFIGYPFENNNENIFLDQYDKLINGLMEMYIYILLSGMNNKNIIIYCGYYHSNNLTYILKKYYNFKNIYTTGIINNIEKKEDKDISNCLCIDKKIFMYEN
jgi:hypothetical protein